MEGNTKLRSLIEAVREELAHANLGAARNGVQFSVERVQLELQFTAREGTKDGVGIRPWFFEFSSSNEVGKAFVQTLKLELRPGWIDAAGKRGDIRIRDEVE